MVIVPETTSADTYHEPPDDADGGRMIRGPAWVPPSQRSVLPVYDPAIGTVLAQPWFHEAARKAREAAIILEMHGVGGGEVSIAVGDGWLLVKESVDHG